MKEHDKNPSDQKRGTDKESAWKTIQENDSKDYLNSWKENGDTDN